MMAAGLFEIASLTRAGGRRENEDYADFLQTGASACWVIADGLGGHRGGAAASRTVVQAALASFRERGEATADALAQHVARAQEALFAAQRAEPSLAQMRSTIVVLVSTAHEAVWAHVGDSRLYHLSGGTIAARTRDHSVSQALVDGGRIDAREQGLHEDRGRLLRCLGKEDEAGPAIATIAAAGRLHRGDTFLLCTDGFWESVDDLAVEIDLAASEDAAAWLDRMEARLRRVNGASRDNFTAIAVRVISEMTPPPPPHDPRVPPAWTGGHRPRADAPPPAASGLSRLRAAASAPVLFTAAALLVALIAAGVWKRESVRAWARAVWTKVTAAADPEAGKKDTAAENPQGKDAATEDPKQKDAATEHDEKDAANENTEQKDAAKPNERKEDAAKKTATGKPDAAGTPDARTPNAGSSSANPSTATGTSSADRPGRPAAGDKAKPRGVVKKPAGASGRDRNHDAVAAPATKKPAGAAGKDGP